MGEQVPQTRAVRIARSMPPHLERYRRLQIQVAEMRENLGGLPLPEEAADIWRSIWYEEAHHSTAIEGNTLILKEVQRLLDEGRAVGNKELREYLEVKGYADAADWVYRQAIRPTGLSHHGAILSMVEVRHIHHAAMTPVWEVEPHPDATAREAPGAFREREIRPFPGGMTPVTWPHVHAEMTAWVAEANSLDVGLLTFPKALASLHCRFEQIHPFLDGNGRTGRLVLNLILVRLGYPPVVIYKRDRAKYLRALRRADEGVVAPWERCSPERSSTASTASCYPPLRARQGWCRWRLSPIPASASRPCARRRAGADCRPPGAAMATGAVRNIG